MKIKEFKSRFRALPLELQKELLERMEADVPNKTRDLCSEELDNYLNLNKWCRELINKKERKIK